MIRRILDWLMRDAVYDHGDTDMVSGALTWHRFRSGLASGSYMLLTNRGGGVVASYNGAILNEGRMLPDVATAQAYCEGHHAAITAKPRPGDVRDTAAAMIPTDMED